MKVRTRSRLILVATLIIFLVALSFVTQSVIIQSFRTIEVQESTAHVQRFVAQLNHEIEDVAATCRDWSAREEMNVLLSDMPPKDDPDRVFPPMTMKNLGIDYIVIYDAGGRPIFSETIDPDGSIRNSVPADLDRIVRESIVIDGLGGIDGRRGMSVIGKDPVVLAGYSIAGPDGTDAETGTLVLARLLDSGRIGDMNQMLQMDGSLEPYRSSGAGTPLTPGDEGRAKNGGIIVIPEGDDTLNGYALITGIENDPSLILLTITTPRPVLQQVNNSMMIVAAAIIGVSIAFLVIVQLLLQRFVLAPMSELDSGMKTIGESGDLSRRIAEKGDEEVVSLTRSFNHMLDQVQQQKSELHALLEEIEQQRDDLEDARRALADRNRDLEELNRKANLYLDIYLDAITYEILNTIMGLRGYAELYRDTTDEMGRDFANKVIGLAKKSGDVIRNIESISRIYKNSPKIRSVDLAAIIKKEMGSRSGARIVMDHCNRTVQANEMLGVVFDNIFSNSIKFGGEDIEISVSARDLPDGLVEISVTDTGSGIDDAMKPHVFDRFMQDTRKRGSYGLGLHIVKMLIESYGGTVWAGDRIPGERSSGAAIRFTLRPSEQGITDGTSK